MKYATSAFLVLSILWVLNSGQFVPLLLCFGLLSVMLVVYLARRMSIVDEESLPVHLGRGLPAYYAWLAWKIVQGSVDVALRAWKGKRAVTPRMQVVPARQKTGLGQVLYANSMTLTPGTVAVDLTDEGILVHALTAESLAEVMAGEMEQRVSKLEG